MKRAVFYLIILIIIPLNSKGAIGVKETSIFVAASFEQDSISLQNPFLVLREHLSKNNYLKPLLLLRDREQEYLKSNLKVPYLEAIILLNSYLNNYEDAYRYEALLLEHYSARSNQREKNSIELSAASVDSLQMIPAQQKIIEIAKDRQVIMLNEEHRHPIHRAFLFELLPALYESGFRYFAAETFTASDSLLNHRGYATQSSGFYTSDPIFGNIVRVAQDLGFTMVAYEYEGEYPEESDPDQQQEIREKGQAQNLINKIIKEDPTAKILVFAGRAHIAETSTPSFSFMAWHFKQLSGIDPFTIDQVQLSEFHLASDEVPLYKYIINNLNPTEPVSFLNLDGSAWSGTDIYDMRVLHPRTQYLNGRPLWVYNSNIRTPLTIQPKKLNLRVTKNLYLGNIAVVVRAFKIDDAPDAIPVDQVLLEPGDDLPILLLLQGTLKIEAKDKEGNVLGSYIEKM